jgi:hypothetical protein
LADRILAVIGVLLPLILAAALSVVAVVAAGPRPARLPGRRVAGGGIAVAVVAGLLALAGQGAPHAGGDPGGRILAALASAAAAVPAGAPVLSRQDSEPSWVTCGAGRSGWTDAGVSVQFAVQLPAAELDDRVGARLAASGWQPAGGAAWTRALPGGAVARASVDPADRSGVWWLRAAAPAEGARCR